jgi:hypothetical protein
MASRQATAKIPRVLARIQLGVLVTRLEKNALGTLKVPTGGAGGSKKGESKLYEMTASQIECSKFLIERLIPRAAQNVHLTGQEGGPILCQVKFV